MIYKGGPTHQVTRFLWED